MHSILGSARIIACILLYDSYSQRRETAFPTLPLSVQCQRMVARHCLGPNGLQLSGVPGVFFLCYLRVRGFRPY